MTATKGQAFVIDFILGLVIMVATLLSVVLFIPEHDPPFTDDVQHMQTLMTEGVPANWNNSTVILPGFLSNNSFNYTKLQTFGALPYAQQKILLGVQSDFSIRFVANNTTLAICDGCGKAPGVYKSLLPIDRVGLYNQNITLMEIQLYK